VRHWTLYDSMLNSTYVAVRQHTWAEKGWRCIQDLLVAMGFPLKQAKLSFSESADRVPPPRPTACCVALSCLFAFDEDPIYGCQTGTRCPILHAK
jgi:CDC45-like protein